MKILVTGSKGFVGKNLIAELKNQGYEDIFEFDIDTDKSLLDDYAKECDFVFHLAGVNRPKDDKEFMEGNFGFTSELLSLFKRHNNKALILMTSSIQAEKPSPDSARNPGDGAKNRHGRRPAFCLHRKCRLSGR